MQNKRKGNSIIEVIVIIVVLTFGLFGAYSVLNNGSKLAQTTENRIKAINIAREGLELVQNIRDTNWLRYSSDYTHCWNTFNYNISCIGATTETHIIGAGSYFLYDKSGEWWLSGSTIPSDFKDYQDQFRIYFDNNGLITQSGGIITNKCTSTINTNCKSIFSREIKISYPDSNIPHKEMKVESIVKWVDSSKNGAYIIDLNTTLTNWKEDL